MAVDGLDTVHKLRVGSQLRFQVANEVFGLQVWIGLGRGKGRFLGLFRIRVADPGLGSGFVFFTRLPEKTQATFLSPQ